MLLIRVHCALDPKSGRSKIRIYVLKAQRFRGPIRGFMFVEMMIASSSIPLGGVR